MAKKKKSPFVSYTVDEVLAAEAVTYVIIAGYNVFSSDGNWFFDKNGAKRYFNKILNQAVRLANEGTPKEKKDARHIINNLRVQPLRLH